MTDTKQIETIPSFTLHLDVSEISLHTLSLRSISFIQKIHDVLLIARDDENQSNASLQISYIWADEAKEIAILLRDGLLNVLKLEYLLMDGVKTESEALGYKHALSATIAQATKTLTESYRTRIEGIPFVAPEWKHQNNPVSLVLEHLRTIEDQIKKIQRCKHKLDLIAQSFVRYKNNYHNLTTLRVNRLTIIQTRISELALAIQGMTPISDRASITQLTQEIDSLLETFDNQGALPSYDDIVLEDIDKLILPVSSQGGKLQNKSIDILSEVSTWGSFNLANPLRTVDRNMATYIDKTAVALFQLSNRLKAKLDSATDNNISLKPNEMIKSITKLKADYNEILSEEISGTLTQVMEKLNQNLIISQLFRLDQNFLPISKLDKLSGSLSYKKILEDRYNLDKIKETWNKLTEGFFSLKKPSQIISPVSYIENVLRFNSDSDANILFMRRGFLGSSFTVERPSIISKMDNHFKLWQSGFGGAILITGSYGSGKSTLIEMIHMRHAEQLTHSMVRGYTLNINGQKISLDGDLIKGLKAVIKSLNNERCIITIDNLTQYADNPGDMYELVHNLLPLIGRYSDKIYFAISIEDDLYQRLGMIFNMITTFTEIIDADDMAAPMIKEAILRRANAVADRDDTFYNPDLMEQQLGKVLNESRGNIGLAMQLWCMYTNGKYDPYGFTLFEKKIRLHSVLLSHLLLYDQYYLPYLKDIYDPVEFKNVKQTIDHLTHIKILLKAKSGYIKINPRLRTLISQAIKNA